MADVVFNKVTLCGFGLYKDPTTFILDPSLAVFAGPNESGKSTFVNGLLATLFGLLRREGDTEGFTTTRFKNWDSPPGFWGELEFTSSGKLYRLRREFESHETRLSIDGDGGPRILFDGEHNRFGRGTEVERYNGILKETLGVADQDLFESVFCVTQETDAGHGEERGGAVQQLVAASGERSFNDVVEKLVEAFRSVTRASGKYGIASPGKQPRDARNEQKLERVEADIRVLKQNIESSSDTLAGLAGLRNDLAEKEKGLERAREEQGRAKTTLEAWDKWEVLKRELHGQEKEQARLGNVISTCEGLVDNLGKAEEALLREYPEFEDAPPDFEDRADEMISLHSRRERIRREQETIESDVRGLFGESVFADRSMENVLEQLNRKADLERDLEEKGQDLQRIEAHYSNAREGRRRKAAAIGFVGFLGGLALGFGLRLETVELILTMVGAGILAGGIAFLVIRPRLEDPKDVQRFQRLTRDVIEIVRALAEVDSVLGELATAGAGELGELREKLRRHTVLAEEIKAADERTSELSSKLHSVLASTQGDPAGAKGRYAEFQKQVRSRDRIASELTVLLKAGQAESIGDLTGRKTHIDNTVQNLITRERALRSRHPSLEQISLAEGSVEIEDRHLRLQAEVKQRASAIDADEQETRRLAKETGHLEGKDLIDVAAEEIRLRGLESKRDQLILEREAIRLAYEATTDAIHRYQESHQEILGNKVNEKFAAFTDRVQRRVELRSDFSPQVFEQGGQRCALEQLSRGAQDQLDLSIRLAVAEMISGDVRIPFIFDDPFLTFDKERLKILREALVELSKSRQVILLTHREELSGWGKAVEPGNV